MLFRSHKEQREVRNVGWAAWQMGGGRGDIAVGLLGDANEAVIRDSRIVSANGMMSEERGWVTQTSSNR